MSAEVTPHHLSMWLPVAEEPDPRRCARSTRRCASERDRNALVRALREGLIEAVATDHAPHRAAEKSVAYDDAAPGMIGLETALATCITIGGMGGEWLATLVERLTVGPHRILGPALRGSRAASADRRSRRRARSSTRTRSGPSARRHAVAVAQHAAARRDPPRHGPAHHGRRTGHPSEPGARADHLGAGQPMPEVRGRLALESGATYEGMLFGAPLDAARTTARWSSTRA